MHVIWVPSLQTLNSLLDIVTFINILVFERKCLVYITSLINSTSSNGLGGQMVKETGQ
jgi:hypothetical protein